MKTLEKYTMVYDADCPLCMAYTNAFVSSKMLDKEGRIPYQQVGGEFVPGMDAERAKNEIALVNRENGQVTYGLESLLTVLEYRNRWIGKIARLQPLNFLIQKFYNFISYNRKVIIPAPLCGSGGVAISDTAHSRSGGVAVRDPTQPRSLAGIESHQPRFDCTPTFKLKYRLAYIVVMWLLTSLTLVAYSKLLGDLIPATNFFREFLICGGQVVFQACVVGILIPTHARLDGKKLMDYLGNMMTVSIYGALLLLPALLLGTIFPAIPEAVFLAYFMLVVGVMLYEHERRMKLLELGWWPSVSWILYRLIALAIILLPQISQMRQIKF